MTSADTVLAELASCLGLESLQLDENRDCHLLFDGRLAVDIEVPDGDHAMHLTGTVGPLPAEGREAIYEQLLEFNLPTEEHLVPCCAVDTTAGEILLCHRLTLPGEPGSLPQVLESFLNHLESWQERLSTSGHVVETEGRINVQGGDGFLRV